MKYVILLALFLLSGCHTLVTVKTNFPEVPEILLEKCPDLKKVKDDAQLSDVIKTVTENYSLYHDCSLKHDSFIEWYKTQKKAFEGVNK